MAGALGLALAGPRIYAAGPVDEPFLNREGRRGAGPHDVDRALRLLGAASLMHGAAWLALAIAVAA